MDTIGENQVVATYCEREGRPAVGDPIQIREMLIRRLTIIVGFTPWQLRPPQLIAESRSTYNFAIDKRLHLNFKQIV